jgi:ribonuclease HI
MLLCEDIAEQKVLLGSQLSEEQERTLTRFLFNNKDVFAWSANDLCGVNRDVIEHSLNVDPSFRPRKQRLRKMSDDKAEGARNEVKRLLSAGVIREVKYPEWLANTVMVKKANGKWRMCIDFIDLNKACPKDEFPLPRIDSLVDAAASSELMSLLDCYSGYHQIWMKKEDEPKTNFITPSGTYCYLRMPEGLKNAGGSFSRMTAKVLQSQIGRNVLTYVDDIIVKSTKQENHIADLQETFANFRQAGLKLNPEKCVFGVKKGKFLGCLVSTKGIEANPSKIEAILRMEPPSTKKGAQRLTGRLASLNRFISRSAERNLPFFEVLKSAEVFQWGPIQQKAFEELKQYLIDLTTLTPPAPGAPLLLYVAASHSAVSAALVQEKLDGQVKKQAPIYFVSEVLSLSKKNYTELEKVLYAVLMASRKLQHYFQAYNIVVPSSQPLKDIMRNREATGRIGKWAAELNEFCIDYVHRSSIQSQALADFIADWTPGAQDEEMNKDAEAWTVFCDGSWGTFGAGAAAVLVSPSKVKTCYAAILDFSCTNNITEYEALLLGLRKLKAMGIRRAILKTDSQVVSGHIDKSCKARDPKLEKYLDTVRRIEASFEGFSVKNIPRGENEHADLLAKSAAQGLPLPSDVFFETIKAPSVELLERAILNISPVYSEDWRTEIISYLQGNFLSDDETYNRRIEARARPYVIIEGELYKHGVCAPLLKCLSRAEGIELMKEIHAGLCGSHIGSRPLLGKVFRQGFYWPKAASDAAELVQKCEGCQKCARDQKQPSSLTQLIQPTWPLQRWGLDLLGPLPPAQGNLRYVVVAVEYFSKWIEAKPLATITSTTIQKFFWQNIVCRFGVPKAITVDNGTQFDSEAFREFCDQIGTKIHFASVRHPESNGLVERANGIIMTGIMKLIFNQPRGKWPDQLIKVVWSHNTTISRSTGFTPFKLLFGDEAITPEEAKTGSIRVVASAESESEADYSVEKDAIEGIRLQAVENISKYQAETIKWHDRKVRLKNIEPGHLVLRRVANPDTVGKLQLKWEGPFLVVSSSRPGSYRLKDMDGNDIPRSWNADELRRYYV